MDMDHGGMHGMEGMMAPPPSPNPSSNNGHHLHGMMHMTLFWGKDEQVLFENWPGDKSGMYALSLIFVFVMAVLVEVLSRTRFFMPRSRWNPVATSLVQTLLHVLRVGLAYLVMLALMSFNGGIFLAALLGHTLGFFFFYSSWAIQKKHDSPYFALPLHPCSNVMEAHDTIILLKSELE